jgi:LEA14-like dessication related protein
MQSLLPHLLVATLAAAGCSRPKPVQVTPRSVELTAVGPQGIELGLVLDVHNPNGFALTASDVKGKVELSDGVTLGSGVAPETITVPAEQTTAASAKLGVSWTNITALAPFVLSAQPVPYRIVGSARIGGERLNLELPFTITGQLTREQVAQIGLRGAGGIIPTLPGSLPR